MRHRPAPPLPLRRDCRCACHVPGAHVIHVVPCCRCPHGSRATTCTDCAPGSGTWLALGAVGALAAVTAGVRVYRSGGYAGLSNERLVATRSDDVPAEPSSYTPRSPVGRSYGGSRPVSADDVERWGRAGSRATPGTEWLLVGLHSRERWRERVPSTKRGYVTTVAEAMADRNNEPVEVYRVSISSTRPVSWVYPVVAGARVRGQHLGDVSLLTPEAFAQARRKALALHAVSQQSRAKNTAKRCPLLLSDLARRVAK